MSVADKDQRADAGLGGGEGDGEDPMAEVVCLACGQGDDDENLLLCDGAPGRPAFARVEATTDISAKCLRRTILKVKFLQVKLVDSPSIS